MLSFIHELTAMQITGAVAGILLATVPAIYLGVVIGGNLGGGWAAYLGSPIAVIAGIVLGFSLVAGIILVIGAVFGVAVATVVERLMN
jgi:hypothetical protein